MKKTLIAGIGAGALVALGAVVGTPAAAAERLRDLAAEFAVDEVMVHPVAAASAGTPRDASPAREETLRLLAKELG